MKKSLLDQLTRKELDINALTQLIKNGIAVKKYGFFGTELYKEIGLFELNNGYNIFHILAQKKCLSTLLPVITANASNIVVRECLLKHNEEGLEEKANNIILDKLLQSDKNGYNPIHYSIKDLNALKLLIKLGADFTVSMAGIQTPLEMIIKISRYEEDKESYKELIAEIYGNIDRQKNFSDIYAGYWPEILDALGKTNIIRPLARLFSVIKNHNLEWGIESKTLSILCSKQTEIKTEGKNFVPIIKAITEAAAASNKELIDIFDPKNVIGNKNREKIKYYIETGKLSPNDEMKLEKIKEEKSLNFKDKENLAPNAQKNNQVIKLDAIDTKKMNQEFSDFTRGVLKLINTKASKQIEKDLKRTSNDLLKIISVATGQDDFFLKILKAANKNSKCNIKSIESFLEKYLQEINEGDLIFKSGNKQTAYELACSRDNLTITKLLLARGVEIGLYNKGAKSIFDASIIYNSPKVFNYLISNEQKDVIIDWSHILFTAIKYARLKMVESYINSKEEIITEAHTSSNESTIAKYTILNKALKGINDLLTIERFDEGKNKKELILKSFNKSIKLMECLSKLINAEKIFYAEQVTTKIDDNYYILDTTRKLLKQIKGKYLELSKLIVNYEASSNKINIENVIKGLESLHTKIINKYKILLENNHFNPLKEDFLKLGEEEKNNTDTDLTIVTHFSALSQIDNTEYKVEQPVVGDNNNEEN